MAELNTIARPYAKAAFASAQASGSLPGWGTLLAAAAATVRTPDFEPLIGNPGVEALQLADLLDEIGGRTGGEHGLAFLKLLAERRRLDALPAIYEQFDALRADAENRVDVEVTSAVELTAAQKDRYAQAMKQRLGRDVVIHARIDESILGGAVVRAGDLVIDGSVKGRLEKLAASLAP